MRMKFSLAIAAVVVSASAIYAQAPVPVAQTTVPVVAAAPAQNAASNAAMMQSLQQLKATNDELLKKQAATLQQLDEIAKAAEQIRILSARS